MAVLVTAAVAWSIDIVRRDGDAGPPRPLPLRSVRVETNNAGQVVAISASSASAVLQGYLRIDPSGADYEPAGIAVLPRSDLRLGILRWHDDPQARFAIEIRRVEGKAQIWSAGDGRQRIRPRKAELLDRDAATIPIESP